MICDFWGFYQIIPMSEEESLISKRRDHYSNVALYERVNKRNTFNRHFFQELLTRRTEECKIDFFM